MELVIFHYHLKPGGVTSVIADAVRAFLQDNGEWSVRIVCGSDEGVEAFLSRLDGLAAGSVRVDVEPLMGYAQEELDKFEAEKRVADIVSVLERFCGQERVLWVHNFHLGKNPYFTEAVLRLIEREEQRVVLHVHDFPESGRYDNLSRIHRYVSRGLYPVSNNVRYALINSRDLEVLALAGIPRDRLFLLDNPYHPLDFSSVGANDKDDLAREIGISCNKSLFLSPVRAIRRKNIIESALIASLADAVYAVSLPGTSAQEKHYSELVDRAMRESGNVSSLGLRAEESGFSFMSVLKAADSIISSSVQEGFGYLFLQAIDAGKPLVARRLDILDGFDHIFESYPVLLYDSFFVPADFFDLDVVGIRKRYDKKIKALASFAPEEVMEEIAEGVDKRIGKDFIEFSFLPVQMQYDVFLRVYGDMDAKKAVLDKNPGFLSSLRDVLSRSVPLDSKERLKRFSLAAHKKTMLDIIDSFYDSELVVCNADDKAIESSVMHSFARPDYVRLLYDF